jgi:hypothetical protein
MQSPQDQREPRIRGYAKETALCIDVALAAVEDDIRAELDIAADEACAALRRVLTKLHRQRKLVEQFTKAA